MLHQPGKKKYIFAKQTEKISLVKAPTLLYVCVISGFRRKVDEVSALLGYYANLIVCV
jgi:hypothetical protein